MISIDDTHAVSRLDPGGMLQQVASFPSQLARARVVQRTLRQAHPQVAGALRHERPPLQDVVVCGMGGSAIGGEFVSAWAAAHGVRVSVLRGYDLPSWVRPNQLCVFSSYSGNTEETLSAYEAARQARLPALVVTTGGRLGEWARRDGVPCIDMPGGLQPRAALGHSLVALAVALHASELVEADPVPELESCARFLESVCSKLEFAVPESQNPAKQLARLFHGVLPCIYSAEITSPVATRWKGQLNENAKALAMTGVFPEMNHNEIMAWSAVPELRKQMRMFLLCDPEDPRPVQRRMRLTSELLEGRVASIEWLDTRGESRLQRLLGASFLGDHASVYLSFLNQVDPTPVAQIERLKELLAATS